MLTYCIPQNLSVQWPGFQIFTLPCLFNALGEYSKYILCFVICDFLDASIASLRNFPCESDFHSVWHVKALVRHLVIGSGLTKMVSYRRGTTKISWNTRTRTSLRLFWHCKPLWKDVCMHSIWKTRRTLLSWARKHFSVSVGMGRVHKKKQDKQTKLSAGCWPTLWSTTTIHQVETRNHRFRKDWLKDI